MDGFVGLRPDLAIDAGAVGDGFAALERLDQPAFVVDTNPVEGHAGQAEDLLGPRPPIHPASQDDRLVTTRRQRLGKVATDEARTPGDGYAHGGGWKLNVSWRRDGQRGMHIRRPHRVPPCAACGA